MAYRKWMKVSDVGLGSWLTCGGSGPWGGLRAGAETSPGGATAGLARTKPGIVKAFLRFGVVGAIGTVVNLAVLQVLYRGLGLGFTRSSAMATEVAILGNYLGNELWVFHHRRLSLRRMLAFNATMIVGAVVQVTVATVLKDHIHHLLAQAIGIVVGSGLNFAANFGWTWRR